MPSDDAERDHFFAEVYQLTTAPFLSVEAARGDVQSFLAMAQPPAGGLVLDLGCGWGRHLSILREKGLRPLGIERASGLARAAESRVAGAVVRADLRALPLLDESADAATCFYSSLFFFDEAGNMEAMREVARVLRPGAPAFLETANPIYLRRLGPQAKTLPLPEGSTVFESAEFDVATGRENGFRQLTKRDGSVIEGRYSIRYYAPGELEALALRAGLKVERVCGDHDLGPFTRQSREMLVLIRKPRR